MFSAYYFILSFPNLNVYTQLNLLTIFSINGFLLHSHIYSCDGFINANDTVSRESYFDMWLLSNSVVKQLCTVANSWSSCWLPSCDLSSVLSVVRWYTFILFHIIITHFFLTIEYPQYYTKPQARFNWKKLNLLCLLSLYLCQKALF